MITVLPLGPAGMELLTKECEQFLDGSNLILRTARHPVADDLSARQIPFCSMDALYDECEDFDELQHEIASRLLHQGKACDLVYAVPDPESDGSVRLLRQQTEVHVRILPGVSLSSYYLSRLPQPFSPSPQVCSCSAMNCTDPDPDKDLLITEIHSKALAGDLKIMLSDLYPDETEVVFFSSGRKTPSVIPLYELDRQKQYDHTSALFVPSVPFDRKMRYSFSDLMHIMSVLRSQDGCAWDQAQTHQSLRPYLLEEAYEAAGAIDEDDMDHLCDELGDVLLQVAFHASIAESCGDFSRTDISTAICSKMIRRHPGIFGHSTEQEADETWDQVKKQERRYTSVSDSLSDVSRAMPALSRAAKIQNRAGKLGVDFKDAEEALQASDDLIHEILYDLQNRRDPGRAFGLLLFEIVSAARHNGKDPEEMLSSFTERFVQAFSKYEQDMKKAGKTQNPLTLQEMNVYLRSAY